MALESDTQVEDKEQSESEDDASLKEDSPLASEPLCPTRPEGTFSPQRTTTFPGLATSQTHRHQARHHFLLPRKRSLWVKPTVQIKSLQNTWKVVPKQKIPTTVNTLIWCNGCCLGVRVKARGLLGEEFPSDKNGGHCWIPWHDPSRLGLKIPSSLLWWTLGLPKPQSKWTPMAPFSFRQRVVETRNWHEKGRFDRRRRVYYRRKILRPLPQANSHTGDNYRTLTDGRIFAPKWNRPSNDKDANLQKGTSHRLKKWIDGTHRQATVNFGGDLTSLYVARDCPTERVLSDFSF